MLPSLILILALSGAEPQAEPQTNAGSDGWPAPQGQAATGVESGSSLLSTRESAVVARHARQAQPVLRITQSGKRTTGSVIQADAQGTWILTCRHGRRASDPWVAGPLSGSYTRCADKDDLALLWTRERWSGPVYEISRYDVALPVRFIVHDTLPRALPVGCPLWEHPGKRYPGESGTPLLCEGRVAGVLWGTTPASSLYVRRDALVRFLREVRP